MRVAHLIQGGRTAILAPEHRATLMGFATRLGLRPFDASLVIAIVQDSARTGDDPLGEGTQARVSLVRPAAQEGTAPAGPLALAGMSLALAAGMFYGMVSWLGGM